jgi:predicted porin
MTKSRLMLGTATAALCLVLLSHPSSAQSLDDVNRRLDRLEKENAQLKQQAATPAPGGIGQAYAADLPFKALACGGHGFLERKKGDPITFYTCDGEITAYGNFNVSIDDTTKDIKNPGLDGSGLPPLGNFGWMPAISSNLSYLGARGFERVSNYPFNFVYQFEVGIDISATPGLRQSNSSLSDTVNGALFNRNTFIGIASDWGAVKIGKTDAPYKNATAMFNPFAGMLGDYAVVMGNTGGDNRVEFGTRLDHSIWYESPVVGGLQFNFLFSPGQNRDTSSGDIPAGGSDCAGGNDPTSGGNLPVACNDGSYSNVVSTNISYTNGGFYVTAAYEWHQAVNRQSDITAIYGGTPVGAISPVFPVGSNGQTLFNEDVANEDAFKVGALYKFPTKTTVGAIFESMHRYVSADLQFQNERTRNGTWVFLSQELSPTDSVHFGWAHAFATPGDPGQHNDAVVATPDGFATVATNQNQADMLTAAYRRNLSKNLSWYTNVAATFNGPSAHYDLGAGGRGVTTDCHDAFGATGGAFSSPHCWTGTTLVGVSSGLQWRF